jgi:hypothetical protein
MPAQKIETRLGVTDPIQRAVLLDKLTCAACVTQPILN